MLGGAGRAIGPDRLPLGTTSCWGRVGVQGCPSPIPHGASLLVHRACVAHRAPHASTGHPPELLGRAPLAVPEGGGSVPPPPRPSVPGRATRRASSIPVSRGARPADGRTPARRAAEGRAGATGTQVGEHWSPSEARSARPSARGRPTAMRAKASYCGDETHRRESCQANFNPRPSPGAAHSNARFISIGRGRDGRDPADSTGRRLPNVQRGIGRRRGAAR